MALFADSTSKVVPEFYHFWVVNFTKIWNRKFTDYRIDGAIDVAPEFVYQNSVIDNPQVNAVAEDAVEIE